MKPIPPYVVQKVLGPVFTAETTAGADLIELGDARPAVKLSAVQARGPRLWVASEGGHMAEFSVVSQKVLTPPGCEGGAAGASLRSGAVAVEGGRPESAEREETRPPAGAESEQASGDGANRRSMPGQKEAGADRALNTPATLPPTESPSSTCATLVQKRKLERAISRMELLEELGLIVVLASGVLSFRALQDFAELPVSQFPSVRGVTAFSLDELGVTKETKGAKGAKGEEAGIHLVATKKRKTMVFRVTKRGSFIVKELPQAATAAVLCGNAICLADSENYIIIDIEAASAVPLLPISQTGAPDAPPDPRHVPCIACVGKSDFLVASHTDGATLGVFVTQRGEPCRGTLEFPANLQGVLIDGPHIVGLLADASLVVYSLQTQALVQKIELQGANVSRQLRSVQGLAVGLGEELLVLQRVALKGAAWCPVETPEPRSSDPRGDSGSGTTRISSASGHPGSQPVPAEESRMLLLGNNTLHAVSPLTWVRHADTLVSDGYVDDAITLALETHALVADGASVPGADVAFVLVRAAFARLREGQLSEALDLFLRGCCDPRVVLGLFGDLRAKDPASVTLRAIGGPAVNEEGVLLFTGAVEDLLRAEVVAKETRESNESERGEATQEQSDSAEEQEPKPVAETIPPEVESHGETAEENERRELPGPTDADSTDDARSSTGLSASKEVTRDPERVEGKGVEVEKKVGEKLEEERGVEVEPASGDRVGSETSDKLEETEETEETKETEETEEAKDIGSKADVTEETASSAGTSGNAGSPHAKTGTPETAPDTPPLAALMRYLEDWRQFRKQHKRVMRVPWLASARDLDTVVDTCLARLYLSRDPEKAVAFLSSDNTCDRSVLEDDLLQAGLFSFCVGLYAERGDVEKAGRLMMSLIDGDIHDIARSAYTPRDVYTLIKDAPEGEFREETGLWLLAHDRELGLNVLSSDALLRGSEERFRGVLERISAADEGAAEPFLEARALRTPRSDHTQLVVACIARLRAWMSSAEPHVRATQRSFAQLTERFADLKAPSFVAFLTNEARIEQSEFDVFRLKTALFLSVLRYDSSAVKSALEPAPPSLFALEWTLVYSRLGLDRLALSLLLRELQDLSGALAYCLQGGELARPAELSAVEALLPGMDLARYRKLRKDPEREFDLAQLVRDVYLADPPSTKHSQFMAILEHYNAVYDSFPALPLTWPAHLAKPYATTVLRRVHDANQQMEILKNIATAQNLRVELERIGKRGPPIRHTLKSGNEVRAGHVIIKLVDDGEKGDTDDEKGQGNMNEEEKSLL